MARQTLYKLPHDQTEPWPPIERQGPMSNEPAREVFREGCAQIALALQSQGFKYFKGKQCCTREHCGFSNEIWFQSSRYNSSGWHVQLSMHAAVSSKRLQAWRVERLPNYVPTAHVAGGMVHLLGNKFALVQWELADPEDREATVLDALSFINSEVMPYFVLFEDPASLIQTLTVEALPALELVASVEFAYCYAGRDQAQAVLSRFVIERPDLAEAIDQARAREGDDYLMRLGSYADQVIFLERQYGLSAKSNG